MEEKVKNKEDLTKNKVDYDNNLALEVDRKGTSPKYISKKTEYRLLLRLIKRHKISIGKGKGYNIQTIVNTLNINPKTARKWLETPKVQQAIADELEYYISKMQETGANDWRQWAKQVELAQGVNENTIKNNNQLNVVIVNDKEKGIFEIHEV
ncbi:MAG: hypothetical protein Q7K55_05440 [Candidatus Levybacteria bacterium]|nr:hypothetical protein [Candidatus Levybacteria bacterium]